MLKTKKRNVVVNGKTIFILIDRPKPDSGYALVADESDSNVRVYSKPGEPNQLFARGVRLCDAYAAASGTGEWRPIEASKRIGATKDKN
jgi:hypothetical protein